MTDAKKAAEEWANEYWQDEVESPGEAEAIKLAKVSGASGFLAGAAWKEKEMRKEGPQGYAVLSSIGLPTYEGKADGKMLVFALREFAEQWLEGREKDVGWYVAPVRLLEIKEPSGEK